LAPELTPVSRLPPLRSLDRQASRELPPCSPSQESAAALSETSDVAADALASQPQLPAVLTIDELADFLRVNHKTVRDAIARGDIPGVRRLGTATRIHTATVLAWLASGQARVSRSKRFR
jgi:excisionase family DNA binding protein